MTYDLKEHGLIDEEGKVTLVGRIILETTLQAKEYLEKEDYSGEGEVDTPTCNMNLSEIKIWEEEHQALWAQDEFGGFIELMPIHVYTNADDEKASQEGLGCTIVNETADKQIRLIYTDKKELIRLRDYLTKYIERK